MGMDSFVSCRCHELGLGDPCPVSWRVGEFGVLQPGHELSGADVELFDAWQLSGCTHEEQRLVWEYFGNWHRVGLIAQVLDLHADEFPALRSAFQAFECPPELSAQALAELDPFEVLSATWTVPRLVDADTDKWLTTGLPTTFYSWHTLSDGRTPGLDPSGTFQVRSPRGRVVFEATEFTRAVDGKDSAMTKLTNEHGKSVVGDFVFEVSRHRDHTEHFRVDLPEWGPADLAHTTHSYRLLFEASVSTGNPVLSGY